MMGEPAAGDLFESGKFVLNSGQVRDWKIECDRLSDGSIKTMVRVAHSMGMIPPFREVISVPRGGDRIAEALREYQAEGYGCRLLVDDVLTSGGSMERKARELALFHGPACPLFGFVLFACRVPDAWIKALCRVYPIQDDRGW